jgi:Fe2+ transport system protein FeoA
MKESTACKPLRLLCEGEEGVVVDFDGDLSEAYRIRLMEFGFHPGETVSCLLKPGFGAPHVYRVSNTVYSLDKDISDAVFIRVADASSEELDA